MTRPRRLLAALAAALAATVSLSACDSSPYAASVNSQVIKQTGLNAELRQLTSNRAYVDQQVLDSQQPSNPTPVVSGQAPGTYNAWVADVLTTMVYAVVVHQHVAAAGAVPGPAQLAAARAVDEVAYGAEWSGFSPSYRGVLDQRLADLAAVEPVSVSATTISQDYQQYRQYFFSEVCVRVIASSVTNSEGTVNAAASLAQANSIRAAYQAATPTGRVASGGSTTCYSAEELFDQPSEFVTTVLALAPGQAAAPQRTDYGYQVVGVDSRVTMPLDATRVAGAVRREIGGFGTATDALLKAAHVKINPEYGSWGAQGAGSLPRVLLPAGPKTTTG